MRLPLRVPTALTRGELTLNEYALLYFEQIRRAAFGMPEVSEQELRKRYSEYAAGMERGLTLFAAIDGRVPGSDDVRKHRRCLLHPKLPYDLGK